MLLFRDDRLLPTLHPCGSQRGGGESGSVFVVRGLPDGGEAVRKCGTIALNCEMLQKKREIVVLNKK